MDGCPQTLFSYGIYLSVLINAGWTLDLNMMGKIETYSKDRQLSIAQRKYGDLEQLLLRSCWDLFLYIEIFFDVSDLRLTINGHYMNILAGTNLFVTPVIKDVASLIINNI